MSSLNLNDLEIKDIISLNEISSKVKESFNSFISELAELNKDNIEWFMSSSIASRDILLSSLFVNCCYLVLVKEKTEKGEEFEEVITSDKGIYLVLRQYFAAKNMSVKVKYEVSNLVKIKKYLYPLFRLVNALIFIFNSLYLTVAVKKEKKYNTPVTLLDIFILKESFSGNKFSDRYYPGLFDCLREKEKECIYYVPTFFRIKNYMLIREDFKKTKNQYNFLFKEHFLKPRDYLYAISYPLREISYAKTNFWGFDIKPLIKEDLRYNLFNLSTIISILNFRFVKRLKENRIDIRLVINWFENQVIDKGLNAGFSEFYSGVLTKGYQGFIIPDNYFHIQPIKVEKKLIPDRILVMGKGLINKTKKYCKDLNVEIAPAFRFNYLWDNLEKNTNKWNQLKILVLLPMMVSNSIEILKVVNSVKNLNKETNYKFYIKPHPTFDKNRIARYLGKYILPDYEVLYSSLKDFQGFHLMIGNSSSACLETIARGIPVIIIGSQSGLTQNPIPESIKEDIWKLCYTTEELKEAIHFYADRDEKTIERHRLIGEKIREEYFEPVTREAVRKFLELD